MSDILAFQIQRALASDGPFQTVDAKGGNADTDLDFDLTAGIPYYYRIRARNVSGFGPWSNVVEVTLSPPIDDPIPDLNPWFYLRDDLAGSTPDRWDDISGNGRHWNNQAGMTFPTLTASGFDFQAGDNTTTNLVQNGLEGPDLTVLNGTADPAYFVIYCQRKSTDAAGPWDFGTTGEGSKPYYPNGSSTWRETYSRPNVASVSTFNANEGAPLTRGHCVTMQGGNTSGSAMQAGWEGRMVYGGGNVDDLPDPPIVGNNNDVGEVDATLGADMYIRAMVMFDYELTQTQVDSVCDYLHQLYGTLNYRFISQMLEVGTSSPMYDPGTFVGNNQAGTISGGTRSVLNGINMVTNGSYLWSGSQSAAFDQSSSWNAAVWVAHGNLTDDGMLYINSSFNGNDISFGFRKVAVGGGVQHQWVTGDYASYTTHDIGPVVTETDTLYHLAFTLDFTESAFGTLRLYFNGALDDTIVLGSGDVGNGLTMQQFLGMRSKTGETPTSRVGQFFMGVGTSGEPIDAWPAWVVETLYNGGDGMPNNDDPWY
jgi:hypothetical protein